MTSYLRPRARLLATGTLVGALLVAGAAGPAAAGPVDDPAPALVELSSAAVETALRASIAELLVPGAVVHLSTPGGDIEVGVGTDEWDGGGDIAVSDHFRIGSVTKTWTATAILQMVQEGLLGLDDPISQFRDDVPNGDNITIRQLLAMRSGLANYTLGYDFNKQLDVNPARVWTQDELLELAWTLPPTSAPGTEFEYSNTNYILLGLVAEELDGKPLSEVFQDRFFDPLGMTETSLPDITDDSIPCPHPRGYMFSTNVLTLDTAKLSDADLAAARDGSLLPIDYTDLNPSWAWAAGSGISTAGDLATWATAMADGTLLDADTQKDRIDSLIPTGDEPDAASYGLGIAQFGPLLGHTGELPGFNTFAASDTANGVTLVIWTNLAPNPEGKDPAVEIAKTIIGMLYPPVN